MAKKKTKKVVTTSSSEHLFKKHRHLSWLFPLFIIAVVLFLLMHHHFQEEMNALDKDAAIIEGSSMQRMYLKDHDKKGYMVSPTADPKADTKF